MKIDFISLLHDELKIPPEPCSPASLINWSLWHFQFQPGAIIRDGDRKSWDLRGPMIWDNFYIFRTNCAILTTHIRADPCTYELVRVVHLHSTARALSSPSRCFFRLSTNLGKDLFRCLLSWDATTIFTNVRQKFTNIMCFFHVVKLYTAKII